MHKLFKFTFLILVFSANVFASDVYFYRVRSGDQLGVILMSLGYKNLWGASGSVNKISETQKTPVQGQGAKILKNGNLIEPGTWLDIHTPIALHCNIEIFAREITRIKKKIKTQTARNNFRCPDGSRNIASIPAEVFERHGRITIRPHIGFSNTKVTDNSNGSQSEVSSESNIGAELKWEQVWSEKASSYLSLDIESLKIAEPGNRTITGDNSTTLTKIGAGFRRQLNENLAMDANFKYGSEFFIFAPSNNEIRLDTANLFSAGLGVDYTFADLAPFVFGAKFGTHFLQGVSVKDYKSKASFGLSGGLFMEQKLKNNKHILGDIIIRKQNKDTDLFNQDLMDIRFNFGISWELK